MVHGIIEAAHDKGADMVVIHCPFCQTRIEIYQHEINQKFGSKFKMPVVYYSQLVSVDYGRFIGDSALDGQIIKGRKLEEIAAK